MENAGIPYQTRDEAIEAAQSQAKRYLSESDTRISYVAFIPDLYDYCLCEWNLVQSQGWVFSCRMLPDELREPDEQITDAQITEVARTGSLLMAIRLYRGKYSVSLEEGKKGVNRLMQEAD